jgi:hypothetical protein
MKSVSVFHIPKGAFGLLNVLPDIEIFTYQFVYQSDRSLVGPDWYVARYFRPDLIEVTQVEFIGTGLEVKNLLNRITSENGYYAILRRNQNMFGLAWSEKCFIANQQRYVV